VKRGAPVHERFCVRDGQPAIGHVASIKLDRHASAVFVESDAGRPWLPIVRPGNQSITALRAAQLGESLRAGKRPASVDGFGFYRVRHELAPGQWKTIEIEGIRLTARRRVAPGALVFDEMTATGVGLACAGDRSGDGLNAAIACKLPHVMAGMGLRMATFDDLLDAPFTAPAAPHRDPAAMHPGDAARARAGVSTTADPSFANDRLDIATVIWPALRRALKAQGVSVRGIRDRVESVSPLGDAHEIIAGVVNRERDFASFGFGALQGGDLAGAVTFDQICERLNDLAESGARKRV
jgi:hypothetical protein